jgi:hypothetical protein
LRHQLPLAPPPSESPPPPPLKLSLLLLSLPKLSSLLLELLPLEDPLSGWKVPALMALLMRQTMNDITATNEKIMKPMTANAVPLPRVGGGESSSGAAAGWVFG